MFYSSQKYNQQQPFIQISNNRDMDFEKNRDGDGDDNEYERGSQI